MRLFGLASVLTTFILAMPAAQNLSRPSALELATLVQAHYSTVRQFTADFTQSQKTSLMPRPRMDRGSVAIKKPLKMRWAYTSSEKQEFISDGVKFYSVFPQGKYFLESRLPSEQEQSTWLLFLAGRGDLTRDFTPSLPPDQPSSQEWRLLLKPIAGRVANLETLTLEVDRTSYQFRGLIVVDEQGGTNAYRFINVQENRRINERLFVFEPPRGYQLMRD